MREELQRYLEDTFLFEFGGDVTPETNLFSIGIIDSFGYVQMIRHLEKEYGIRFTDDELLSNVLVSLNSILACAEAKRAGR
ncbi:acyl carrier protein [Longimicrobium sp.]|jgi:acyl carrier protein|uniref:acyl carrier protein n=1 Tax=Longimicrobium sp. TaxID=2029185 RepID=UPI002ED839B0